MADINFKCLLFCLDEICLFNDSEVSNVTTGLTDTMPESREIFRESFFTMITSTFDPVMISTGLRESNNFNKCISPLTKHHLMSFKLV